jgi:hypothetical protein
MFGQQGWVLGLVLTAVSLAGVSAAADEWGNLSLRFVYDGEPPQPQKILVDKDKAYCGKKELLAETLVVNAQDRGLANVVVWIEARPGEKLAAHPSYDAGAKGEVVVAIEGCQFSPRISFLRTTQTLNLVSRDPVGHNPQWHVFNNSASSNSRSIPTNGLITQKFADEEMSPARLDCSIHPWMSGFLLIRQNPYMAASDASGKVKIANLPTGKHMLRVWHESATGWAIKQASHAGAIVNWPRGRMTLEIKPGENDLGEFKLSPEIFRK